MKRISFVTAAFLLLSFKLQAQSFTIETNEPQIIYPLLNDFANICLNNNLGEVRRFLADIKEINFVSPDDAELNTGLGDPICSPDGEEVLGRVIYNKKPTGISNVYVFETKILLSTNLKTSQYAIRHTLWHEIGHVMGLEHNPKHTESLHVMNEGLPMWYVETYLPTEKMWEKYKEVFLIQLQDSNKKKWRWRSVIYHYSD